MGGCKLLNSIKSNMFLLYAFIIGVSLFFICCFRATVSGITYDESYTYFNYTYSIPTDCFYSLTAKQEILANNHVLNSFLISCVESISKIKFNEFLIRLPNLICYIFYLIISYKLSKNYNYNFLIFNILVFNYGVHEFFGLARGYGIACFLSLAGVYFLDKWYRTRKYNYLDICYYIFLFACYANTVSLINLASVLMFS